MEARTVWHPRLPEDDPNRYRNFPSTDEERERLGLYYDQHGMFRERRGIGTEKEWGAEVSACQPGCDRLWTDPREAHCAMCHAHFGGDQGFDLHVVVGRRECRDPRSVKKLTAVPRKFGLTWIRPPSDANFDRRS